MRQFLFAFYPGNSVMEIGTFSNIVRSGAGIAIVFVVFAINVHFPQFANTFFDVRAAIGSFKVLVFLDGFNPVSEKGAAVMMFCGAAVAFVKAFILFAYIKTPDRASGIFYIGTAFCRFEEIIGLFGIHLSGLFHWPSPRGFYSAIAYSRGGEIVPGRS
ncbi:MAG: hypothetical protein M1543_04645 [Firmicutes bacterium]|nr:hypothetical protein [Bacillota bacterium]